MDDVNFGALIALWLLAAVAVGVFARKVGFALVMVAFAVMWTIDHIWDERITSGWGSEWFWFLLIAIPIGIYTLMAGFRERSFRPRTRAGAGAFVLIVSLIMAATPFNVNLAAPFQAAASAILSPSFDERVNALKADMEKEYDSAFTSLRADVDKLNNDMYGDSGIIAGIKKDVADLKEKQGVLEGKVSDLDAKVKGTVTTELPTDLTKQQIADAIAADLVEQGINPEDVTFFTINWDKNVYDVGNNPFSDRMIDSTAKLYRHINGSSDQSRETRAHILAALPKSEEQRALRAEGYIPMQFHVTSYLEGNTWYNGAKKKALRDDIRKHDPGDVIWVYVGSDGKVYWDASVRADCGNAGMTSPPRKTHDKPNRPRTPRTPGTPGTPSTSTPTPSRTPTPTPTPSKTCPPNTEGKYCKPKATASPAPSVSRRPTGTTTATPSSRPTHSGPTISTGSGNTATTASSDGHTSSGSATSVATATATGAPANG